MKVEKLSLDIIKKNVLSRDELKKVMAGGSGGGGGGGGGDGPTCGAGTPVYWCYDSNSGDWWTVEWCCGPFTGYAGGTTSCSLIGHTPSTTGQNIC